MVKFVLSCDGGGGVRGLIAASFLSELEKDQNVNLFEAFDLFAGANSGALTTLSIATEQATAKEVIERFYVADNLKKYMGKGQWQAMAGLVQAKSVYPGDAKTAFMKQKFSTMKIHSAPKPVVVPLYNIESRRNLSVGSEAEIFPLNLPVTEVADASTATPLYYPPVKSSSSLHLIDGSVVCSDPSLLAFSTARRKWGDKEEIRLLSISCGQKAKGINGPDASKFGGLDWLQHDLLGVVMDGHSLSPHLGVLLGPAYLRVDGELKETTDDFDETSPQNLEQLRQLGKDLYQKFKPQLMKFFEAPKTAPKDDSLKKTASKANLKKLKEEEERRKLEEEARKREEAERKKREEEARKKQEEAERKRREQEEALKKKKKKNAKMDSSDSDEDSDDDSEDESEDESSESEPEVKGRKPTPAPSPLQSKATRKPEDSEEEDSEDESEEEDLAVVKPKPAAKAKAKETGKDAKKKQEDSDEDDEDGCIIS